MNRANIFCLCLWFVLLPGSAQSENLCDYASSADVSLEHCSVLINSGMQSDRDLSTAYAIRGFAFARLGDLDSALSDLDNAVIADPTNSEAFRIRGYLRSYMGETDAALADYGTTLALDPENLAALIGRCELLSRLGRHAEAISDCEGALMINPGLAMAYNNLAVALFGLELLDIALSDAELALSADPDNAAVLDTRAHILSAMGRRAEALQDFILAAERGLAEVYQSALLELGYFQEPIDGALSQSLIDALSDCVEAGCALLMRSDPDLVAVADAPPIDQQSFFCLVGEGIAYNAIMTSSDRLSTLILEDGSVIAVANLTTGVRLVAARNANGLFDPDLSERAQAALGACLD